MFMKSLSVIALLTAGANAHFRLLHPGARGNYNGSQLHEFCGGHTEVTTNRTEFPLSGGVVHVRQGHEKWYANIVVSTAPNPNSNESFEANGEPQYVVFEAYEEKPGNFCIPVDFAASGIAGLEEGANVTISVNLFDDESSYFQCADLTLSSTAEVPACVNATAEPSDGHGTPTGSGAAPSGTGAPGEDGDDEDEDAGALSNFKGATLLGAAMGLVGVAFAL
ncbi:hypothetical protein CC1G_05954 [Coprinopsis cinerea okayama7|uniref:Copper acquisition factor BIM1-like domain-containing protein n=1 Tax=Coprinopsis cinerea (strain Okayama-7 / 130 / ATCC MYA-4618 / FGSC 9003) TaxID=240176 RepID=A8NAK3_COPC7|nr:hypothetical protein CC1G_05954 [Coprinopsis cinerea okayama7\|eukprot:XP_001831855.2 hypothetical protein CC1G_05954 [Coprinopsis cinerea okayama7\